MNMDQAILQAFPLVAASTSGEAPPATQDGMRYVVGKAGIWREITLPWVRARHQVVQSMIDLPYGETADMIEFRCGPVPRDAIRQFAEEAREAAPTEIAAAFLWNEETGQWRYARREAISSSADHIEYREVTVLEAEHLVVDVHSHGHTRAFFSHEDNRDDRGTMRVSLVLGDLDREVPSSAMRLCLAGLMLPAAMGADGSLEVSP